MDKRAIRRFQKQVWDHYRAHGRHTLPWRTHITPYRILVSELMLQQTQVDRVVPKFTAFIKKWPTVSAVSKATLGEVLRMWQGLGYNRRAKHLHECAKIIMEAHSGRFPKDQQTLQTLSGIGPYTAAAIMNFAYEIPTALIETNVRTVFLHHFFPDATNVKDVDL
ncbi:A/G-specific adenine glycosylase, partial [Candidatus Kaiserbacteria bacterium]|nr:A/G-specific adenine glycosylase [Candidatus Kaiserbacteria bacterium]